MAIACWIFHLKPQQVFCLNSNSLLSSKVDYKDGTSSENGHVELVQSLYAQIGELKVANDFFKKKLS
jgi:hypothetical protein